MYPSHLNNNLFIFPVYKDDSSSDEHARKKKSQETAKKATSLFSVLPTPPPLERWGSDAESVDDDTEMGDEVSDLVADYNRSIAAIFPIDVSPPVEEVISSFSSSSESFSSSGPLLFSL